MTTNCEEDIQLSLVPLANPTLNPNHKPQAKPKKKTNYNLNNTESKLAQNLSTFP